MLSLLGTLWASFWLLTAPSVTEQSFPSLTAVAALALLTVTAAAAIRLAAATSAVLARAGWDFGPVPVRDTERLRTVPRLSDPDAAGRPRSRAPSANPAA